MQLRPRDYHVLCMTTTSPRNRHTVLEQQRNLKMARSAHAFVRGSTQKFYEWLTSISGRNLPAGPPIWICGDCHLSNLGPLASADGRVTIAVRDLDQTVIGNPAHDLIRLALSLATAARGSDLPGVTTAQMLEAISHGYERGILHPKQGFPRTSSSIGPVKTALRESLKRNWRHLAEERIEDVSPTIPKGKNFWPLTQKEISAIERLFESAQAHKLVTCLKQRGDDDKISVADAAYWMKGCSSLGRLRYAVLVRVGKGKKGAGGFCLIDIKEAVAAAAPHVARASMPHNQAVRVVAGARSLSPFLGERMLAAQLCDRDVFLRELMPQDLKLEVEKLNREEAVAIARFLAEVLGHAHGRQMSESIRREWIATIKRNRSKNLEAPSWLWTNVVDLIALHEKAYLDHCRHYALHI